MKQEPQDSPLMTASEVAKAFNCDPRTITRWAKAGKLDTIRTLGGHRRYRRTQVEALTQFPEGGTR